MVWVGPCGMGLDVLVQRRAGEGREVAQSQHSMAVACNRQFSTATTTVTTAIATGITTIGTGLLVHADLCVCVRACV